MLRTVALSVAIVGLLGSGCSNEGDRPRVLPTLGGSASPTLVPVVVPLEARGSSSKALDAFVRFYFKQLNVAFSTSDPAVIRSLSDPRCATCENYAKALEDGAEFIRGESFAQVEVAAPPVDVAGTVVQVLGVIPARDVLDSKGAVVKHLKADGRFRFEVNVLRSGSSWIVRGIRLAK